MLLKQECPPILLCAIKYTNPFLFLQMSGILSLITLHEQLLGICFADLPMETVWHCESTDKKDIKWVF